MGWAALGMAAEKSVEEKYVALAASASVFNTEGLCYGHSPFQQDSPETAKEKTEREQFEWLTKHATRQESEKLLHHSDPKVRLLAVGTLFNTEDPQALPAIAKLAGDTSEAIHLPGLVPQSGRQGPPRTQTVGEAARMVIACYLTSAGCTYQGFNEYWEKYGNLDHCLSWFAVRLSRAMRGGHPPSPESRPEILQVRRQIDQLPENDRVWVLLGLRDEYEDFDEQFGSGYANMLASREELIQMLKTVGSDQALAFLQRKQVTKDPDFQPDGDFRYQRAARMFVFKNAAKLFGPKDADALIAQGKLESGHSAIKNPWVTGWWWIAASEVRKDQAESILLDGYMVILNSPKSTDSELFLLVKQMCRINSAYFINFINSWFFHPGEGSFDNNRSYFVEFVARLAKPTGKQTLENLLLDPKADRIRSPDLAEFAIAINSWVSNPVATREEISKLKGQTWKGGGVGPEMVPGMLDRLRKSIPQWKTEQ